MPDAAATDPYVTGGAMAVALGTLRAGERLVNHLLERRKESRKRDGGDEEHEAKQTTRAQIRELAVRAQEDRGTMERIADRLRDVADIQQRTVKELEEFRRETDKSHTRIEQAILVKGY